MLLKNATVYGGDFIPRKANIRITGEKIEEIGACAAPGEEIDFTGCTAVPGFIDIHIHGCAGGDLMDASEESLGKISACLASHGVTSFCPTSMTLPEEKLADAFRTARGYMGKEPGAYIHGINMEGPYISKEKKGAQCGEYVRQPDFSEFQRLYALCPIRLVDVAPESEGAFHFARQARELCTVSAAHTAADYATACAGFQNGFTHTTHLFNAMTGLTTREAGVAGAALENANVTTELICDGFHIAPAMLRLAFAMLGEDRACVVSDSMKAAGLPDGDYALGGQPVYVRDGKALLKDGTIAASTSNIHQEFLNLLAFGIPFETALRACTINPARAVRVERETGSLVPGHYADITVLDANNAIKAVFVKGKRLV